MSFQDELRKFQAEQKRREETFLNRLSQSHISAAPSGISRKTQRTQQSQQATNAPPSYSGGGQRFSRRLTPIEADFNANRDNFASIGDNFYVKRNGDATPHHDKLVYLGNYNSLKESKCSQQLSVATWLANTGSVVIAAAATSVKHVTEFFDPPFLPV